MWVRSSFLLIYPSRIYNVTQKIVKLPISLPCLWKSKCKSKTGASTKTRWFSILMFCMKLEGNEPVLNVDISFTVLNSFLQLGRFCQTFWDPANFWKVYCRFLMNYRHRHFDLIYHPKSAKSWRHWFRFVKNNVQNVFVVIQPSYKNNNHGWTPERLCGEGDNGISQHMKVRTLDMQTLTVIMWYNK